MFFFQTDLASQLQKERDLNLRSINSQLLLLESNLRRRQEELATMLRERDITIRNQHRIILALASAYSQITGHGEIYKVLANTNKHEPDVDLPKILREILSHIAANEKKEEEGLKKKVQENDLKCDTSLSNNSKKQYQEKDTPNEKNEIIENKRNMKNEIETVKEKCNREGDNKIISDSTSIISEKKPDLEKPNDTDSAIMLEDTCSDSLIILPCMRDGVKVIRSVSDALECVSRPLQLPPNNTLSDSSLTTPVNSPPASPHMANMVSLSYADRNGSLSSTPFCSSSEESDGSPVCSISKARSTSLQQLEDIGLSSSQCAKSAETNIVPLTRSISEDPALMSCLQELEGIDIGDDAEDDCESKDLSSKCQANKLDTLTSSVASPINDSLSDNIDSMSLAYDSDSTLSDGSSDCEQDDHLSSQQSLSESSAQCSNFENSCPDRRLLIGSYEKLNDVPSIRPLNYKKKPDEMIQVTYNRVMSNHRSVTKVKDVKYKRINKAKSRSLEELRGKLRIHEGKPLISVSIGHSYA